MCGSRAASVVAGRDAPFREAMEAASTRTRKLLSIKGRRTVDDFHRELGLMMWDHCGMTRNEAGLKEALRRIPEIRAEFWENVLVPGQGDDLNQSLERACRVADYLEYAELMALDALERTESCGCHFREESQTEGNEARRDDQNFSHVSVWQHMGEGAAPKLHREPLEFNEVEPSERSYV